MTAARQERKAAIAVRPTLQARRGWGGVVAWPAAAWAVRAWVALMLAAGIAVGVGAAQAQVVTNHLTGLAIEGYDPVAYFSDSEAVSGDARFETSYGGAVWRFRSDGNRRIFRESPEIYAPQFGGYDPYEAAHGKTVPGHPELWLVTGRRLYLFYSERSRKAFVAAPEATLNEARYRWPSLRGDLPKGE